MELSFSSDGQHYVIGLVDGSFIIKSKQLEEFKEEQDDEMKMVMDAFNFEYKSKAKNYKYFYRGQYNAIPDPEDLISGMKSRKLKLQKYEQSLKKFQYKKALNEAIDQQNPEVVLALIEELLHRGALEIALANRSEEELIKLIAFIKWKVADYRY
jgi:U3 small nucleolar RNA-associated protein 15